MRIDKIEKVIVTDKSGYDPSLCCNGGRYAYYTEYQRENDDLWVVIHKTSSDFEYCSVCGRFGCHDCTDYERINTGEMLRRLAEEAGWDSVAIDCYTASPDPEDELIIRIDE